MNANDFRHLTTTTELLEVLNGVEIVANDMLKKLPKTSKAVAMKKFDEMTAGYAFDETLSVAANIRRWRDDAIAALHDRDAEIAAAAEAPAAKAPKTAATFEELMARLDAAKAAKDQKAAKVIRAALRRQGYRLSLTK